MGSVAWIAGKARFVQVYKDSVRQTRHLIIEAKNFESLDPQSVRRQHFQFIMGYYTSSVRRI